MEIKPWLDIYNLLFFLAQLLFFFLSQIGRSTESPIDFVVTDTVPGSQSNADTQSVQSTISRFACRIICQRTPPYTARIYAAGFDSSKNIFLGVSAFFLNQASDTFRPIKKKKMKKNKWRFSEGLGLNFQFKVAC